MTTMLATYWALWIVLSLAVAESIASRIFGGWTNPPQPPAARLRGPTRANRRRGYQTSA